MLSTRREQIIDTAIMFILGVFAIGLFIGALVQRVGEFGLGQFPVGGAF